MNRRHFLQSSAVLGIGSMLPRQMFATPPALLKAIGIQLFSLPKVLEKDFRQGIAMLAGMGYREIEMYGPFPFSTQKAKDSWAAVTPALGFSGSGYFGLDVKTVASILKEHKMTAPAIHTDLETLEQNMGKLAEAAHELGHKYAGIAAIPPEMRTNLDGYKKTAELFNKIGAAAKKEGLKFSYHNHGYGLHEMEGQRPLDLLLANTDPSLVFLEMDIYWMTAGGGDPVGYLQQYKNRYHLMHIKDMSKQARFSGDGGDPSQWIELFPFMTTAGKGVLDLPVILNAAKKSGVKHFFVEQDMVAEPEVALKKSIDFLKSV